MWVAPGPPTFMVVKFGEISPMDIDPRRSLSQQEFCWLEHISKAKFYELKKRGLTPDEIDIDGVLRITPKARETWHARNGHAREERSRAVGSCSSTRTGRHRGPSRAAVAAARIKTTLAQRRDQPSAPVTAMLPFTVNVKRRGEPFTYASGGAPL
jgi:hypothetical protein